MAVAAAAALALLVFLTQSGGDSESCKGFECGIVSDAPDPGGDESSDVVIPPEGILYGFNENPRIEGTDPDELVSLMTAAGANSRRYTLDWRLLEPTQDVWNEDNWLFYEEAYEASIDQGMTPVINIGFAPQWAREPGDAQACSDFYACRYPPARSMNNEWQEFATETARRFPDAVLEIWNEPNLAIFWRPAADPQRFSELVILAAEAIRRVNQDSIILVGGLAGVQEPTDPVVPAGQGDLPLAEFLAGAEAAAPQLYEATDGISFHPYPFDGQLGAGSAFATAFEQVRAAAGRSKGEAPGLWVTELGVPSEGQQEGLPEVDQADLLLRAFRKVTSMDDVEGIFVHRLLPPTGEPPGTVEHGYALLAPGEPDPLPKPAFCALVDLARNEFTGC